MPLSPKPFGAPANLDRIAERRRPCCSDMAHGTGCAAEELISSQVDHVAASVAAAASASGWRERCEAMLRADEAPRSISPGCNVAGTTALQGRQTQELCLRAGCTPAGAETLVKHRPVDLQSRCRTERAYSPSRARSLGACSSLSTLPDPFRGRARREHGLQIGSLA
mmetsp:Transcript_2785/g.6934  ORF Transcript_2785/g.6934 Transcript_2785/m.6934 type:complete len:167 (-) Transcript_2785:25-525(-)